MFGGWGVLGVALGVWGVFVVPFWLRLVLCGYCSATVLLEGLGLWVVGGWGWLLGVREFFFWGGVFGMHKYSF